MSPPNTRSFERIPGILPICPPPRPDPNSHKTPELPKGAIGKHPKGHPNGAKPKPMHQRRLGLIPDEQKEYLMLDERKEPALNPSDSNSVKKVPAMTNQEDFPTLNSSVKDFLGMQPQRTTKPMPPPLPPRRRDSIRHQVKVCNHLKGRKCFGTISTSFGQPDPRNVYKEVEKWLCGIVEEEFVTPEQQYEAVKGLRTFDFLRKQVGRDIF